MAWWVGVDGLLVRPEDAHISIFDRGVTLGEGVHTSLRVSGGRPRFFERHLARLLESMERTYLPREHLPADLREEILRVIEANEMVEGALAVYITPGRASFVRGPSRAEPLTLFIQPSEGRPLRESGHAITVPETRDSLRDMKCTCRSANVIALREALSRGADEAIFVDSRGLVEGTCVNLIGIDGGEIVVPDLSGGRGLAGIASTVLCERLGLRTTYLATSWEKPLFMTNSCFAGVFPVLTLDGRELPRDEVALTLLRETLDQAAEEEV